MKVLKKIKEWIKGLFECPGQCVCMPVEKPTEELWEEMKPKEVKKSTRKPRKTKTKKAE